MTKPIVIIVLIATVIGLLVSAKDLLMPTLYYPYLVINVKGPETIRIHILQRGQTRASQCTRSLASATAIAGSCPICSIQTSNCTTDLGNTMRQWLDDGPLATPSGRMANGVMVFESPQQQIALAACQESERQSLVNTLAARLTCFPPGTERPLLNSEKDLLARGNAEQQKSLVIVA